MSSNVMEQFQTLAGRAAETLENKTADSRILIQVGSATCEHAAGSNEVFEEFRKHVAASERHDIGLRQTGCTGRCSREPIVGVFVPGQMPVKYERVDRQMVHEIFTSHILQRRAAAGSRAGRAGGEDRPLRVAAVRRRPLRLERAEAGPGAVFGKAPCGRHRPGPVAVDGGQLLRRLQRRNGRQMHPRPGAARQGAVPRPQRGRAGRDCPAARAQGAARSSICG